MRRLMTMVLAVMLLGPVSAEAGEQVPVCGDVNDSASLTSTDALLVLKKSVFQPIDLDCSAYDQRFSQCESSLAGAVAELSACQTELAISNEGLEACGGDLAACEAALPAICPCFDVQSALGAMSAWTNCNEPLHPDFFDQTHILCSDSAWDQDDNCNFGDSHLAAVKTDFGGGAIARSCSSNIGGESVSMEIDEKQWVECRDVIQAVVAYENLCCQWNNNVPLCF